ncbi:hypothetical protein [Brevibacillus brevis]|uniref:hypothetical protein n=2 Tax=Brevibacillus brevis TaxID=1393 RepID=UPI000D0EDFF0|nr:hypothetical protein [Brevibacillus brevis]PSJ67850.1 hypothetical protein C7J99_18725 [Brevibacillus brevis]RED22894.1 YD repeat-containing protein [Brevibacillus brevis]GEC91335.1 hypothetical protein BBR01nite_36660 [Brevibacillus brevis]VEF87767.1 Uncharacterised protein [Brevibacillus brevis]
MVNRLMSFTFVGMLILLTCFPMAEAKTTQNPIAEVSQMDREILGLQQTLSFFQTVAEKKGDKKLAKKIEKQISMFSQKNTKLHAAPKDSNRLKQQEKIKKHLEKQKNKIQELQKQMEQQVNAYWEQLMPELSPLKTPPIKQANAATLRTAAVPLTSATPIVDPFEPNDETNTSYPIISGNLYTSKLSSANDTDMYRLDSGSLFGEITVTLSVPKDKNYDLLVLQDPSKVVGSSMNSERGLKETVTFSVQPNTIYYIAVFSMDRDYSETDSYSVNVSKVKTELALAQPVDISLPVGEIPAYRFTAPVTGTYRFFTGSYGGFGVPFDTLLLMYQEEQMQGFVDFNDEASDGSLYSEIKINMTAGTTYFLYVPPYDQSQALHTRLTVVLDTSAAVTSPTINEATVNDGSISEKQVINLTNGTFHTDVASAVTVNHLPQGLQPVVTRNSETQLTIQFTGNASNHEKKHSVQNVYVTIPHTKITGTDKDVVTNTFGINFTDTESLLVSTPIDINLQPDSKKIVKFTPPVSGNFEVFTDTNATQLAIYEDYGQTRLVVSTDAGSESPFSKVTPSLQKGQDYYVVLSVANNSSVQARLTARYIGVEYVYNAKGQLVQIRQNDKILTEFIYDGNGNLTKKTVY